MKSRLFPALACVLALLSFSGSHGELRHHERRDEGISPEAVLYGAGFLEPGAVVRLHQAEGTPSLAVDEVLATVTVPDSGRWAIRYSTSSPAQHLYFGVGDTNGSHAMLSGGTIVLVPQVPPALVVARPSPGTIKDTWAVH